MHSTWGKEAVGGWGRDRDREREGGCAPLGLCMCCSEVGGVQGMCERQWGGGRQLSLLRFLRS